MFKIDKKIGASTFYGEAHANKALQADEEHMLRIIKDDKSKALYDTFNNDFNIYLQKLPAGPVKSNVSKAFNRSLIYLAVAKIKLDNAFSKIVLVDNDTKLSQILLSTQQLNIDPLTGKTKTIDECVYATYFSLIRAAIITNKKDVRQDVDLHKLLSTYLYLLFLKAIGSDKIYSEKQKVFIRILSVYLFYKYYLKEKHDLIISIMRREYSQFINKDFLEEFLPTLEELKFYDSIKDLPKMLIDAKILNVHPNTITIQLLKLLNPMGFYCLIGSLDYIISLVVLSKYPVEFFSKGALVNEKIQSAVEEIVVKYLDKLTYEI